MSSDAAVTLDADSVRVLVATLRKASSFESLRDTFAQQLTAFGVKMMSYHHLPPLGASDFQSHIAVFAHGFPDAWVSRYVQDQLYRIDPISRKAAVASLPFRWSAVTSFGDLSTQERRYLQMLEAARLGDGLAIPVFGPHGRNGYVGFGFGTATLPIDEEQIGLLHWVAQLGHLIYCSLLRVAPADELKLAPREREVLQLAARGNSNGAIAEALQVSRHTVDTHMRRIFSKLDVGDRVTAVLRALSLGLI
ncbi:MAG: LuxR family transcriptional regulator [Pseudomonadota bacterium]